MKINSIVFSIFIILCFQGFSFTQQSKLNEEDFEIFDFIIVGAGSGGSTLAGELLNRKSTLNILIIEAGTDVITSDVINFQNSLALYGTEYDWGDVSESIVAMNNRTLELTQGRGCGGSTLLNGMVWFRGNKNDYNDWAKEVGDNSWSYENLLPLFESLESYPIDSYYRGKTGPIHVTPHLTGTPYNDKFKKAISSLGFNENDDYNGEDQYGVGFSQLNVKANETFGVRQDAFSGYVRPHIQNPNLKVYSNCMVDKILLSNNATVDGLIYRFNNGTTGKAKAKYEIIISAGAFRTPTILMRSGIGDCDELKKNGIDCYIDLKSVGKNLQDHIIAYATWSIKNPDTNHRTVMDINVIFENVKSEISNLLKPKFQIQTFYTPYGYTIGVILLHPKSKGSVNIESANLDQKPKIELNYLSQTSDLEDLLEGIKHVFNIGQKLKGTFLENITFPSTVLETDEDILNFIRQNAITDFHYVGTCKMGKSSTNDSVVDSKLRVLNVEGLRIADASIMPSLVSGNTNAPAMVIGAKCAQMLYEQYFSRCNLLNLNILLIWFSIFIAKLL